MKSKFTFNLITLLLKGRKAKHRTYVGDRVWELHEDISRIALTLDRINMNPKYRDKRNVEKLIYKDILHKLWYLRKYQRYYRILIT
jgi:hypothetical protein